MRFAKRRRLLLKGLEKSRTRSGQPPFVVVQRWASSLGHRLVSGTTEVVPFPFALDRA
jgi:hypothetical protein